MSKVAACVVQSGFPSRCPASGALTAIAACAGASTVPATSPGWVLKVIISALLSWRPPSELVRILTRSPTWFLQLPAAAACCSNQIAGPGETHVALACLDGPIDREPQAHAFYDSHVNWMPVGRCVADFQRLALHGTLPVYRLLAMLLQPGIGLGEVAAAKKSTMG